MSIPLHRPVTAVDVGSRDVKALLPSINGAVMHRPLGTAFENGWGGDASFTRATSKTFHDTDGIVRTVAAGETAHPGVRVVTNLCLYSQDFSNAAWLVGGAGAPTKSVVDGEDRITWHNGIGNLFQLISGAGYNNRTYRVMFEVKLISSGTGDGWGLIIQESGGVPTSITAAITPTSEWMHFSMTWTPTTLSGDGVDMAPIFRRTAGTGDATIAIRHAQFEDVTLQGNQNPGEHIVTTSAPVSAFFDTENGNTVDGSYEVTEAAGDPLSTVKGVSIEEARTNLITYSEQLDNAIWVKNNVTVTADATQAPDGEQTMDAVMETAINSFHYIIYQSGAAVSAGATLTATVYVKNGLGRDWCVLSARDTANNGGQVWFNITTGTIGTTQSLGTGTYIASSMEPVAGGYRISVTASIDPANTTSRLIILGSIADGVISYLGDVTKGMHFWGAQIEEAAGPSSYIQTVASTVTRNKDELTIPNNGSLTENMTYVVYLEFYLFESTSALLQMAFDGLNPTPSNSGVRIFASVNSSNRINAQAWNGGVVEASLYSLSAMIAGTSYKAAFRVSKDNFSLFVDGSKDSSDVTGKLPGLHATTFHIGKGYAGTYSLLGAIKDVTIITDPARMTDEALKALTA